jgi:hypothetical protein
MINLVALVSQVPWAYLIILAIDFVAHFDFLVYYYTRQVIRSTPDYRYHLQLCYLRMQRRRCGWGEYAGT